jgi:hypothetical protein
MSSMITSPLPGPRRWPFRRRCYWSLDGVNRAQRLGGVRQKKWQPAPLRSAEPGWQFDRPLASCRVETCCPNGRRDRRILRWGVMFPLPINYVYEGKVSRIMSTLRIAAWAKSGCCSMPTFRAHHSAFRAKSQKTAHLANECSASSLAAESPAARMHSVWQLCRRQTRYVRCTKATHYCVRTRVHHA